MFLSKTCENGTCMSLNPAVNGKRHDLAKKHNLLKNICLLGRKVFLGNFDSGHNRIYCTRFKPST